MSYIGQSPEIDAQVNKYEYTATAAQTNFPCVYDQRVDVFLNGVLLSETDYTATNGTEIVLGTGATAGDIVQIDAFQTVAPAELPDQTGNTDKYLKTNGSVASWADVSGGATGAGGDKIFVENGQTVTTSYTIPTGSNAMTAGPITVNSGVVVTVPSGSVWHILQEIR